MKNLFKSIIATIVVLFFSSTLSAGMIDSLEISVTDADKSISFVDTSASEPLRVAGGGGRGGMGGGDGDGDNGGMGGGQGGDGDGDGDGDRDRDRDD